MRYICLVHHDENAFGAFSEEENADCIRDSMAYDERLTASGHMVVAEALRPPASARIVRVRGGKATVTDGPFAETKEQLIGFILIDARDETEALEIAQGIPLAKTGSIEVRAAFDPVGDAPPAAK